MWFMLEYILYVVSGQEMREHPSFITGARRGLLMGHFFLLPPLLAFLIVHYFWG